MRTGLGGLQLRLGLVSTLRELSRSDLEVLGALAEGNSLEGFDKESWLLGVRGLSLDRGLRSPRGRFKAQAFACFYRP